MGPPGDHISGVIPVNEACDVHSMAERFGHVRWEFLCYVPVKIPPIAGFDTGKGSLVKRYALWVEHQIEALVTLEVREDMI